MNCFLIMPFSQTKHHKGEQEITISASEWDYIRVEWFKKAVESFPDQPIKCKASELVPGNFVKGIMTDIKDCEIAIADLTGQKPNVYYELGIRHALRIGTIIITQDFNHVPSDLKSYATLVYDYSSNAFEQAGLYRTFEAKLHGSIRYLLQNINREDSPVSDFLKLEHYYQAKHFEIEKQKILNILASLYKVSLEFQKRYAELVILKDGIIAKKHIPFNFIDFQLFHAYFTSLIAFQFTYVDVNKIQPSANILSTLRTTFIDDYQFWECCTKNINLENINSFFNRMQAHSDIIMHFARQLEAEINTIQAYQL